MNAQLAPAPLTPSLSTLLRPTRPSDQLLRQLVAQGIGQPLSYDHPGATLREVVPDGFTHTAHDEVIGQGDAAWSAAVEAVRSWAMFRMPWLTMPAFPPPEVDQVVAFGSRQLGTWAVHSCRVVACIDEPDRVGFAYGTLATHAVAGEERFTVRRGPTGAVHFELWKFARPSHLLVRLAGPFMVHQQNRFDRGAAEAMRRAVAEAS